MSKNYEHSTLIRSWHAKPHPGCLSPTGWHYILVITSRWSQAKPSVATVSGRVSTPNHIIHCMHRVHIQIHVRIFIWFSYFSRNQWCCHPPLPRLGVFLTEIHRKATTCSCPASSKKTTRSTRPGPCESKGERGVQRCNKKHVGNPLNLCPRYFCTVDIVYHIFTTQGFWSVLEDLAKKMSWLGHFWYLKSSLKKKLKRLNVKCHGIVNYRVSGKMPDAITQDMEAFVFFAVWVGSKSDKKFYWTTGILEGDCVSECFPPGNIIN